MHEELEEQKPNRVSRKLPCDGFIGTVPFLQEFMLKTSCRCSPRGLQQRAQIYCCCLAASTGRQLRSSRGIVAAPTAPGGAATGDGFAELRSS